MNIVFLIILTLFVMIIKWFVSLLSYSICLRACKICVVFVGIKPENNTRKIRTGTCSHPFTTPAILFYLIFHLSYVPVLYWKATTNTKIHIRAFFFLFTYCIIFFSFLLLKFLSLRVFRLLSSSLLLLPKRFGRYVLRPSGVCRTREPSRNFELHPLLNPWGSPVLSSRVRQTPEGRRTYLPKRCGNNNKDEDNNP